MKVIAIEPGFYNGSRRRMGSVFDISDESELGSWMKPYESGDEKDLVEEKKRTEAHTLSEVAALETTPQSMVEAIKAEEPNRKRGRPRKTETA